MTREGGNKERFLAKKKTLGAANYKPSKGRVYCGGGGEKSGKNREEWDVVRVSRSPLAELA